jgi:hypothetical protein
MKISTNGLRAVTRRVFCWGIAGAAPASVFGDLAANLSLLPKDEGQTSDYVVMNGWVLTSKDTLSRRERL